MKATSVSLLAVAALGIATAAYASTPVTTLPVTVWGSGVTLERARTWLAIVTDLYASNGVRVRFELAGIGPTKWGSDLFRLAGMYINFPPDETWPTNHPNAVGLGCSNSFPLPEGSCFETSLRDYFIPVAREYDQHIALIIAHEFGHNFSLGHTPGTFMNANVGSDAFEPWQVAILNEAILQAGIPPVRAALGGLLLNGRFTLQAKWETGAGAQGTAKPVALTGDSGYLWFFNDSNIEVTAKALDACGLNDRFWVFMAGMTDVQVDVTVTDFETGGCVYDSNGSCHWIDRTTKTYQNPMGSAFLPIQDTSAFATCSAGQPAPAPARAGASEPPPDPRTWVCGNP